MIKIRRDWTIKRETATTIDTRYFGRRNRDLEAAQRRTPSRRWRWWLWLTTPTPAPVAVVIERGRWR